MLEGATSATIPCVLFAWNTGLADPLASASHYLAATVAAIGAPSLLRMSGRCPTRRGVLSVFVVAVICLFLASGTFHMLEHGSAAREIARRVDLAAIWTLIAASLTAIYALAFGGPRRWLIIGAVWVAALAGIVFGTFFVELLPERVRLGLYLGLGWLGALAMVQIARARGWSSVRLLMLGGLVYSVGALLDLARVPVLVPALVGPHEVFHLAVMTGAFIHWRYVQQLATTHAIDMTAGTRDRDSRLRLAEAFG